MLTVGMSLGTAWAVRGKFGHEQGAAWAGAIGAISVVLVAKRMDWYHKIFKVALASAFGWGLGGMISYGLVVGYGKGLDFGSVYYGLLMLFVIGILYGFLGGGLFGLAIADSKQVNVPWHLLVVEMTTWGLITYALLINQLEWLMTPPRSELWAVCLGGCIALAWYMLRNNQKSPMKVAVWSALGAGFGFSSGNFLQVLGSGSVLPINFWNVMEYSIGFFGGLGMAYGTLTSSWPVSDTEKLKLSNLIPILTLVVFIPFLIWDQSFVASKLTFITEAGGTENSITIFQSVAFFTIIAVALLFLLKFYRDRYDHASVRMIFIFYFGLFIFISFLLTGIFVHPFEQYLYLMNGAVILLIFPVLKEQNVERPMMPLKWLWVTAALLVVIALFTFVAIQSHSELKGSQVRF